MDALARDEDVARFTRVPEPVPEGFGERWIERYTRGRDEGTNAGFAIVDGEPAPWLHGAREARPRDAGGRGGIFISSAARGRGVATRALRLLTTWAFAELPLERIELLIDTENPASEVVAQRCGYTREGVLRWTYLKPGLRSDTTIYSMLRREQSRGHWSALSSPRALAAQERPRFDSRAPGGAGVNGLVTSIDLEQFAGAAETVTGVAVIPVSVVPIGSTRRYELDDAGAVARRTRSSETVHVPLAHTEGGLTVSMTRGARAAGTIRTHVLHDRITRASCFVCARPPRRSRSRAGSKASSTRCASGSPTPTTRSSRATRSSARSRRTSSGRCATCSGRWTTGDAVGPNMMTRNSYLLNMGYVMERAPVKPERAILEANMGGDKKPSYQYFHSGHGKTVIAECTLTRRGDPRASCARRPRISRRSPGRAPTARSRRACSPSRSRRRPRSPPSSPRPDRTSAWSGRARWRTEPAAASTAASTARSASPVSRSEPSAAARRCRRRTTGSASSAAPARARSTASRRSSRPRRSRSRSRLRRDGERRLGELLPRAPRARRSPRMRRAARRRPFFVCLLALRELSFYAPRPCVAANNAGARVIVRPETSRPADRLPPSSTLAGSSLRASSRRSRSPRRDHSWPSNATP